MGGERKSRGDRNGSCRALWATLRILVLTFCEMGAMRGFVQRRDNAYVPKLVPPSFDLVMVPPRLKPCLSHLPSLTSIWLPFHLQLHLSLTSPFLSRSVFLGKVGHNK